MKERAGIQSVEVGFALLDVLAKAEGPLMLRDLAAAALMSAAKAHRYLVSFQRLGLVQQDVNSAHYDLGPAALQLGLACLSRLDPVQLARQRMPALGAHIGHTVALAVWGNQGPTIIHRQESPHALATLRLGDVMPLLTSATGRCFATYMPHNLTRPMLKSEIAKAQKMKQPDVPTTQAAAQALFDDVRHRGMARVVDAMRPGVLSFCAPVFDSDGQLVLGMVALGPASDLDANWDGAPAQALRQTAQSLSGELGHQAG